MKKFLRLISLLICMALCLQIVGFEAVAVEIGNAIDGFATLADGGIVDSGYCGADEDGKNLSWTLSEDWVLTISGSGDMKKWSNTAYVPWRNNRESISSVIIESGVTNIGMISFYCCTGLTSVTISDSVTSIGDRAFYGCDGLISIFVDSNNQNYYSSDGILFSKDMKNLIQYPAGSEVTSYYIPDSVTSIGDCAFSGCTNLTSVTIPDSVTYIGNEAFDEYNTGLTDIYCEAESEPAEWSRFWSMDCCATVHWGWKPCLVRPIFEDKIAFEYSISLPGVTEAPKVIFSIEGKELSSTTATKTEDGRWSFTCFDIMPSQLDSEISITVLGSDIEIPSYSVREYCIERLENSEDETYKQLISELLRYGALAKELETGSASDMADVDNILPVKSNVLSYENKFDISDENNVWKGATLVLENTITMRLYYNGDIAPDVSAVTCKQHHTVTVNEAKKFIEITGFTPLDYDEAITAKLGDATITYSVGTYIARMSVNGQPLTQRIVEALQNYGRSAEEYAQSSNQNN